MCFVPIIYNLFFKFKNSFILKALKIFDDHFPKHSFIPLFYIFTSYTRNFFRFYRIIPVSSFQSNFILPHPQIISAGCPLRTMPHILPDCWGTVCSPAGGAHPVSGKRALSPHMPLFHKDKFGFTVLPIFLVCARRCCAHPRAAVPVWKNKFSSPTALFSTAHKDIASRSSVNLFSVPI